MSWRKKPTKMQWDVGFLNKFRTRLLEDQRYRENKYALRPFMGNVSAFPRFSLLHLTQRFNYTPTNFVSYLRDSHCSLHISPIFWNVLYTLNNENRKIVFTFQLQINLYKGRTCLFISLNNIDTIRSVILTPNTRLNEAQFQGFDFSAT